MDKGDLLPVLEVAGVIGSLLCDVIIIQMLGNWLAIMMVAVYYRHVISICHLACWVPTSKLNGEVSKKSQIAPALFPPLKRSIQVAWGSCTPWCLSMAPACTLQCLPVAPTQPQLSLDGLLAWDELQHLFPCHIRSLQ